MKIMAEKNLLESVCSLLLLCFIYLVLTLLLIIVKKLFENYNTLFIIRAIFIALLFFLIPFCEHTFHTQKTRILFWIALFYGGLST